MTRGVVYAVSHLAWLEEAIVSVRSLIAHMPNLQREIFLTEALREDFTAEMRSYFHKVYFIDDPYFQVRPRFESMLHTELDQAIFLDADTYFLDQVEELFELLDMYDVAAVPAPQYFHKRALELGIYDLLPNTSEAIPEWNGGLIVANVTAGYHAFTKEWMRLFEICEEAGFEMDQAALRVALVHSGLRIATLPSLYNFRANMPQVTKRKVKILHAHGNLPAIAAQINQSEAMRSYIPNPAHIHGSLPKSYRQD